jgi:hypothetical protein
MENENDFNQKVRGGADSEQFRIEVADGDQGKFFTIKPLGNARYEILNDDGSIGTVQLDEKDHMHCESQGCELDMPLLHAIRSQIQFHQQWIEHTE